MAASGARLGVVRLVLFQGEGSSVVLVALLMGLFANTGAHRAVEAWSGYCTCGHAAKQSSPVEIYYASGLPAASWEGRGKVGNARPPSPIPRATSIAPLALSWYSLHKFDYPPRLSFSTRW